MSNLITKLHPKAMERLKNSKISGEKISTLLTQLWENAKITGKLEVLVLDYLVEDDILEMGDLVPLITIGLKQIVE